MRKKFAQRNIKMAGAAVASIISIGSMGSVAVSAKSIPLDPPVYAANKITEVMISRIVPSESYLEVTFDRFDKSANKRPNCLSIAFGALDPTDYDVDIAICGELSGYTTVYLDRVFSEWPDGEVMEITSFARKGGNLLNNTTGRMYFGADYTDFTKSAGRIDYSRCINSSVFVSGVATECRAEKIDDENIWYQPYDAAGNRVEIPAEEDKELLAATASVVYEPGNWPPMWQWVPDDPEEDDNGGDGGGDDENSGNGSNGGNDDGSGNGDDSGSGGSSGSDDGGDNSGGDSTSNSSSDSGVGGESEKNSDGSDSADDIVSDSVNNVTIAKADGTVSNGNSGSNGVSNSVDNAAGAGTRGSTTDAGARTASIIMEIVDGDGGAGSAETSGGDDGSDSRIDGQNDADNNSNTNIDGDDVGVPELGKEFGHEPQWAAIAAIALLSAAGVAGWWFLFFGKHQRKDKKGEKK